MCGDKTPRKRPGRGLNFLRGGCGGRWRRWCVSTSRSLGLRTGSGASWNTANDAVWAEHKRVLIDDPGRFEGVTTIGVDEHMWRHTRRGAKLVTVIIDLTPIRDGSGRSRLVDMVEVAQSRRSPTGWPPGRNRGERQRRIKTIERATTCRHSDRDQRPTAPQVATGMTGKHRHDLLATHRDASTAVITD